MPKSLPLWDAILAFQPKQWDLYFEQMGQLKAKQAGQLVALPTPATLKDLFNEQISEFRKQRFDATGIPSGGSTETSIPKAAWDFLYPYMAQWSSREELELQRDKPVFSTLFRGSNNVRYLFLPGRDRVETDPPAYLGVRVRVQVGSAHSSAQNRKAAIEQCTSWLIQHAGVLPNRSETFHKFKGETGIEINWQDYCSARKAASELKPVQQACADRVRRTGARTARAHVDRGARPLSSHGRNERKRRRSHN
ncbi:MAG TPA: hypothetical protein VJS92_17570 [Candidatus Polarisedimenticolaceae bacterium]|nr:hypothetical protein [Candidatus Polarisedimenticolaceae bacterium]